VVYIESIGDGLSWTVIGRSGDPLREMTGEGVGGVGRQGWSMTGS
jgi:hypothetical protein